MCLRMRNVSSFKRRKVNDVPSVLGPFTLKTETTLIDYMTGNFQSLEAPILSISIPSGPQLIQETCQKSFAMKSTLLHYRKIA